MFIDHPVRLEHTGYGTYFNSEWLLHVGDAIGAQDITFDDSIWKRITLPRAFNEDEAFRLSIEQHTDTIVWYRKHFNLKEVDGRKFLVEFEGIRQGGEFYLNGQYLGRHENGVMAVGFDLTPCVQQGENVSSCIHEMANLREAPNIANSKVRQGVRNLNTA